MGQTSFVAAAVVDFSEAVDDRVAALLVQGTGITLMYNDVANTLTIASNVDLSGYATTAAMNTALALKANKAGDTFTGQLFVNAAYSPGVHQFNVASTNTSASMLLTTTSAVPGVGVQKVVSDGYFWNYDNGALVFGVNNLEAGRFNADKSLSLNGGISANGPISTTGSQDITSSRDLIASREVYVGAGAQLVLRSTGGGSAGAILTSAANGTFRATNWAGTSGVSLDVATDATLKVRTRLNNADADVSCSAIVASSLVTSGGFRGPDVRAPDNDSTFIVGKSYRTLIQSNNDNTILFDGGVNQHTYLRAYGPNRDLVLADNGGPTTFGGLVSVGAFTIGTLPNPASHAGRCARVTDGGQKLVYSNGTIWLYVHDNSAV